MPRTCSRSASARFPASAQVGDLRPAEAGRADTGRPAQDREPRTCRWRISAQPSSRPRRCAEGQHPGTDANLTLSTTTTSLLAAAAVERRDHRLSQRRAGARARYRAGDRRAGERRSSPPGRTASRRFCCRSSKLPGANVIETVDQIKAMLPQLAGAGAARAAHLAAQRPHDDHPRLGSRRRVHADPDHRAGGDGDLRLPAQPLGDRYSRASRCRSP